MSNQSNPSLDSRQPEPAERCMAAASALELCVRGSSPGSMIWLPAGMRMRRALMDFSLSIHEPLGYQEVKSPCLVDDNLFVISGHADKYSDLIHRLDGDQGLSLRPMSCPNHILAYKARRRSWREMPLAFFEFGEVFRNEPSGSLQAFFRMRQFMQDDAHVFCRRDDIESSVSAFLSMASRAYPALGLKISRIAVSLRPEKRHGSDELWDRAESALRGACLKAGLDFEELPGEGAFYGPKIEIGVSDSLGRIWQMGVAQLDFVLPERFGLEYEGSDGREVPAIIHHALLGSIERAVGVLLESYGVDLPWWLHPNPVVVAPISEKHSASARAVHAMLRKALPGVSLDDSDSPIGKKKLSAKSIGCPFFMVVGAKEAELSASDGKPRAFMDGKMIVIEEFIGGLKHPLD